MLALLTSDILVESIKNILYRNWSFCQDIFTEGSSYIHNIDYGATVYKFSSEDFTSFNEFISLYWISLDKRNHNTNALPDAFDIQNLNKVELFRLLKKFTDDVYAYKLVHRMPGISEIYSINSNENMANIFINCGNMYICVKTWGVG